MSRAIKKKNDILHQIQQYLHGSHIKGVSLVVQVKSPVVVHATSEFPNMIWKRRGKNHYCSTLSG